MFDRLGFPGPLLDADPPIEARTEPEARTEMDAPSSIKLSIARASAPTDFTVACVAADALLERTGPAKDVAAEEADIADLNDAADIWREGPGGCLQSRDAADLRTSRGITTGVSSSESCA